MKNKKKTIAFSLTVLFASVVHAETMVPSFASVADCTTWVGDYANTIPVTFRSPPSNSYFHNFFITLLIPIMALILLAAQPQMVQQPVLPNGVWIPTTELLTEAASLLAPTSSLNYMKPCKWK